MKGATHFIELYKAGERRELNQTPINKISRLTDTINCTKSHNELKTIAVWFIKPKKTNA